MEVQKSNIAFGAKWTDARKVLHSLPEEHRLFQGLNYTLDGKTNASKDVFIKRLDRANEEIQKKLKGYEINLTLPPIKTLFTKPKAFFKSLREQFVLNQSTSGQPYHPESHVYPFERTALTHDKRDYRDVTTLSIIKNDSLGAIINKLLGSGHTLSKELKKAGLEDPHKISF